MAKRTEALDRQLKRSNRQMVSKKKLLRHTLTALVCSTLVYTSVRMDAQAASATAPTVNVQAEDIAQQWKGSVTKYDSARAAMLKEVDRVGHEGSFRPDWGSLS